MSASSPSTHQPPGEHRHLISAVTHDTEAVVGHAELTVLPEHELRQIRRVAVAPELRGLGIASGLLDWLVAFAFDDLALHRLELVVFSFNERALGCYKRAVSQTRRPYSSCPRVLMD